MIRRNGKPLTYPLTPLGTFLAGLPLTIALGLTIGHAVTPEYAPTPREVHMHTGEGVEPTEYDDDFGDAGVPSLDDEGDSCNEDELCWDCTTMGNMICGNKGEE